ncbi:HupE/UreJ family protein [Paenibacillus sp. HN-1]|uniref:HupE/UreJ family protein n=1 Tax=Paenibacillus TaxID=44249 RepID=UPI001CA9F02B|nr:MULTISPECIES: HupE/UreJ family protein [Paenibacillus]MBY9079030.1 HupE/UreJ family protein [Paenibacillus sp. CGMCC 1.18879]MBY9087592.1 HupE/UreJ family protein [Paenibacillus sinensis]
MKRVRRRIRYAVPAALCCILLLLAGAQTTSAHGNNSVAYSDLSADGSRIIYVLQIDMYDLRAAADPSDPDIGLSTADVLDRFVNGKREAVADYMLSHLELRADGLLLTGRLDSLKVIQKEGEPQPFAEAVLDYPFHGTPQELNLRYNLIFESDQWHVNYVTMQFGSLHKEGVIVNELKELHAGSLTPASAAVHYGIFGITNLLQSWIPLLLLGILLTGARSIARRLAAAGAFAAGLVAALVLTALHAVSLPAHTAGALLSLSLLGGALFLLIERGRDIYLPYSAALFGLINGLGLSASLSGLQAARPVETAAWAGFGAGAAAALLAAAAVLCLLLYPLRRFGRPLPAVQAAAGLIGLICIFIQR